MFALLSAMTFNAIIDVPTLLFLLLLAALYPIRKDITLFYRGFSFFIIYWIQLITWLKILHDVLIGIDFVQIWLSDYPDGPFAIFNNLLFGGLKSAHTGKDLAQYLIYTVSCLYCTQMWRTVKWWQIRESVINVEGYETAPWYKQFGMYMTLRVQSDEEMKKVAERAKRARMSNLARPSEVERARKKKLKEKMRKKKRTNKQIIDNGKRYSDEKAQRKQARSTAATFLPDAIVNVSRINIFVLCYQYHSGASFINLIWLVSSFIFKRQTVLALSAFLWFPLLVW
jgi:hypothetical protein